MRGRDFRHGFPPLAVCLQGKFQHIYQREFSSPPSTASDGNVICGTWHAFFRVILLLSCQKHNSEVKNFFIKLWQISFSLWWVDDRGIKSINVHWSSTMSICETTFILDAWLKQRFKLLKNCDGGKSFMWFNLNGNPCLWTWVIKTSKLQKSVNGANASLSFILERLRQRVFWLMLSSK